MYCCMASCLQARLMRLLTGLLQGSSSHSNKVFQGMLQLSLSLPWGVLDTELFWLHAELARGLQACNRLQTQAASQGRALLYLVSLAGEHAARTLFICCETPSSSS
jgi:hypothetical protein